MHVARYDGLADWFDQYQAGQMREVTALAESLVRVLLPRGVGPALDLGCGTGRHCETLRSFGYDVVGADLCTDSDRADTSRHSRTRRRSISADRTDARTRTTVVTWSE